MAIKTYVNSAWEDCNDILTNEINGARESAACARTYANGAWADDWNSKIIVVENGEVINTSIINGFSFHQQWNGVANWGDYYMGSVETNSFPTMIINAENEDETTEWNVGGAVAFTSPLETIAWLNGIPKPDNVTKMYVKGNITTKSIIGSVGAIVYGMRVATGEGRYNDDGYIDLASTAPFEFEIDLSNYNKIWCGIGFRAAAEGGSFTLNFKITDLYFE